MSAAAWLGDGASLDDVIVEIRGRVESLERARKTEDATCTAHEDCRRDAETLGRGCLHQVVTGADLEIIARALDEALTRLVGRIDEPAETTIAKAYQAAREDGASIPAIRFAAAVMGAAMTLIVRNQAPKTSMPGMGAAATATSVGRDSWPPFTSGGL